MIGWLLPQQSFLFYVLNNSISRGWDDSHEMHLNGKRWASTKELAGKKKLTFTGYKEPMSRGKKGYTTSAFTGRCYSTLVRREMQLVGARAATAAVQLLNAIAGASAISEKESRY